MSWWGQAEAERKEGEWGNENGKGQEETTETKKGTGEEERQRALSSTTVVASRRTLHSKVSTQRACHERRRAVEMPLPSASWSPPPCQPACLLTAASQ